MEICCSSVATPAERDHGPGKEQPYKDMERFYAAGTRYGGTNGESFPFTFDMLAEQRLTTRREPSWVPWLRVL
jgi:hypothetical protein